MAETLVSWPLASPANRAWLAALLHQLPRDALREIDLDTVIETIITDSYGDDEQYTAFLTVIEEQTPLPARATLLGAPVTVTGFDYSLQARGLTAVCQAPDGTGVVALADLSFPADTEITWIHAAYRHYLGLRPFPAKPRPDWTWPI